MSTGYQLRLEGIPTLGEQPSTEDMTYFRSLSSAFSHMVLGDRNPLWNNEEDLHRTLSFVQPITALQGTLNDRLAHRFPLSDITAPKDPTSVLNAAIRYTQESPFVAKAARTKTEFSMSPLVHNGANVKANEFYDDQIDRLNLDWWIPKILFSVFSVGICVVWWGGEETRQIQNLEIFDPRTCQIIYNFGKPSLFLKIDEDMRNAALDPEGKINIKNKIKFQSMPRYWVDQIIEQRNRGEGNGYIQIQDGSFSVIDNRLMTFSRAKGAFDGLPLQPAFEPLQRYRLLAAGDYATAWNLKNMITLISEGDPKAEGREWRPISTARLNNLQATFQRADTNYVVYCDPTTKVEFVIPPVKDIFTTEKYAQVEKEIKEILGLPSFMWISEQGSNYSNAINEMKSFRVACRFVWDYVIKPQFFKPFYIRLREGAPRPGFQTKDIPYPAFNDRELQDDVNFMKQRADLYSRGVWSAQDLVESAGGDFAKIIQQKKDELANYGPSDSDVVLNDTLLRPLYEPSQGNIQPKDENTAGGNAGGDKPSGEQSGGDRRKRTN
jgi:hypothetical protein